MRQQTILHYTIPPTFNRLFHCFCCPNGLPIVQLYGAGVVPSCFRCDGPVHNGDDAAGAVAEKFQLAIFILVCPFDISDLRPLWVQALQLQPWRVGVHFNCGCREQGEGGSVGEWQKRDETMKKVNMSLWKIKVNSKRKLRDRAREWAKG